MRGRGEKSSTILKNILQVYVPQNIRKIYFLHKILGKRIFFKIFALEYALTM